MPPLNNYNGNNCGDIICSLSTQSPLSPTDVSQAVGGAAGGSAGSSGGKPRFSCPHYAQKMLLNLNALRLDSRFCDVEIKVGDATSVHAHRAVLSASSAYFEAMFRPELGLSEGKQKTVTLHSIRADILELLVEFIYTGQIEIEQVSR